jgi:hypothetical protein
MNALYYGDNLAVLRENIADESVDLIYLDPPFNSAANYNVLFKAPSGERSHAQIEAFEDTWHWNESAERAFDEVVTSQHSDAAIMLRAMRSALGENDMMAYLAMMAVRLIELHRVLKPAGSLYPTQKPLLLLERIVRCSSNPGEVLLDPFCGCGTAIHAAQKLERAWMGIDVTHLAVALVERRLKEAFPGIVFEVHGVPKDYAGARDLAERDKYEFQKWITATIGAQPYKSGKKGMDRGIDGYLHFRDAEKKPQFGIVSVKGGENINSGMVRDLKGTMDREKAALGLFLTLNEPTREMVKEAAATGFYETGGQKIPRLQILTAEAILEGKRPQVPFGHSEGFKKAGKEEKDSGQGKLI